MHDEPLVQGIGDLNFTHPLAESSKREYSLLIAGVPYSDTTILFFKK